MRRFSTAFFLLAALVATPSSVEGQVRLGVRGGLNIADVGGDEADSSGSRTAPNVGLTLLVPVSDAFSLQFGAGYSGKGTTSIDGDEEVVTKLGYVEIPALLRYDFAAAGPASVHLAVGPSFAFKTSCELEGEIDGDEVSVDCDELEDLGEEGGLEFESFDVGATAGAGIDYRLASGAVISAELFYTLGLRDIVSIEGESADVANRAFSLLVGFSLPVG